MRKYSDEELLTVEPELAQIFAKKSPVKLPVPSRKTLPFFRKNYSSAVSKYNRSPFAKRALGSAFDNPTWQEQDISVPVRDGCTIKIRTYVPKVVPVDGLPVAFFCHGGGWIMGDLDTEAFTCRLFAAKLNVIAINVDYRLYPDVEFGVPATDTLDAIKWVSSNAGSLGGNLLKGFIVGGNSGGATLSAIATHLSRDQPLEYPITGCYYSCPIFTDEIENDGEMVHLFDRKTQNRSHDQASEAPLMNREMQMAIVDFAEYDPRSPLMGPFHCPPFHNIPPTYIQVCGLDPWQDSGILYEQELQKVGIETRLNVYPGLPHAFWTTFPQLKATETYLKDMLEGMRWLLQESLHAKQTKL